MTALFQPFFNPNEKEKDATTRKLRSLLLTLHGCNRFATRSEVFTALRVFSIAFFVTSLTIFQLSSHGGFWQSMALSLPESFFDGKFFD